MKTFFRSLSLVCALLATALVSPLCADEREFTQEGTGKKIVGEVTGVNNTNGTVTIMMPGNRSVTFRQDLLVEDDREYLKEWAAKNAHASQVRVEISKTSGGKDTRGGDIYQTTYGKNAFNVVVRNNSASEKLEPFTVRYTMVIQRSDDKTELKTGTWDLDSGMLANSRRSFTTDEVELGLKMKSLSSCPKCVDHASQFKGDSLEGILVEVISDGKVKGEFVFPNTKERRIREAIGNRSAS